MWCWKFCRAWRDPLAVAVPELEEFPEVADNKGGAGVEQRLPACPGVHADDGMETGGAARLNAGHGVLDDDALLTGQVQEPGSVLIGCGVGLAGQPFLRCDDAVDDHLETVRQPCRTQHRRGVP